MNEWSGPMWNDCGACNWIRRSAVQYPRVMCAQHRGESMLSLANLAANLRIVAALIVGFGLGRDYQHAIDMTGNRRDEQWTRRNEWHPGCGRPAPGWREG